MQALLAVLCYALTVQAVILFGVTLAIFKIVDVPEVVRLPGWSPYAPGARFDTLGCLLLCLLVTPFMVFAAAYAVFKVRDRLRT